MSENFDQNLPGRIGKYQASVYKILRDEESRLDARIPVLCQNQLDLISKINESVAQANPGICVIIRSPVLRDSRGNGTLFFDDCTIRIRVLENVLLNRAESGTKIPAQLAAEQILLTVNNAIPEGCGAAIVPTSIEEISDARFVGVLVYEVVCKTAIGFGDEVETPQEE
jgi:hypothetical protein